MIPESLPPDLIRGCEAVFGKKHALGLGQRDHAQTINYRTNKALERSDDSRRSRSLWKEQNQKPRVCWRLI